MELEFIPKSSVTVEDVIGAMNHDAKVDSVVETFRKSLTGVKIEKNVRFADSDILKKRPKVRSKVSGVADLRLTSPDGTELYVNVNDTLNSNIDVSAVDWSDVRDSGDDVHSVMTGGSSVKRADHQREALAAHDAGVELMQIYDWFDMDTILDMIKSRFVMQPRKIFARNTEARVITQKDANGFLERYHMQGGARGQFYCVGLFDKDKGDLVQVQTFGKSRFDKDHEWEAIRLASKSGVIVVGGVSKGFSKFVKDNDPESVVSYVDADRSVGDADEKTGFSYVRQTTPTDVWFDPFGKNPKSYKDTSVQMAGIDKILGLPASDFPDYVKGDKTTGNTALMLKMGYVRVPTSGSFVYEWRK